MRATERAMQETEPATVLTGFPPRLRTVTRITILDRFGSIAPVWPAAETRPSLSTTNTLT